MITHTSRLFRRFAGVCFVALAAAVSAFGFEGKVDMKITTASEPENELVLSYRIKDKLIRTEFQLPAEKSDKGDKKKKKAQATPGMGMIIDSEKKELIMLMPEQKMYLVQKLPDAVDGTGDTGMQMDFKPTGRKERIAGIEAEEYAGKSDGKPTEIWVTKELGKFVMANQGGRGKKKVSAWEAFAQKGDFFALRTIQRKKEGGPEEFRMEVFAVDKSKQDASHFVPPADYEKIPSMGGMLKSMIPGGGDR